MVTLIFNLFHATDLFWYPPENRSVAWNGLTTLTLSWRRPLSYRNQSIDLLRKSMDWGLFGNGLGHERVKDYGTGLIILKLTA